MTQIFGILNITPDSFSDGGVNFNHEKAVENAKLMVKDGVFAIDVGAESTRVGATPIDSSEEIRRLENVIPEITKLKVQVSLDTRNYQTAKWGLENGVTIINDVSGFADENMIELVAKHRAIACFMHSLTVPADLSITMEEDDILAALLDFAKKKIAQFRSFKISKSKIIFDIGLGFGKTAEQSIFLIKNIEYFKQLGVKLLVGHSRKSFLSLAFKEIFDQKEPSILERDLMTAVFSSELYNKVDFLRLHKNFQIWNEK